MELAESDDARISVIKAAFTRRGTEKNLGLLKTSDRIYAMKLHNYSVRKAMQSRCTTSHGHKTLQR